MVPARGTEVWPQRLSLGETPSKVFYNQSVFYLISIHRKMILDKTPTERIESVRVVSVLLEILNDSVQVPSQLK